MLHNASTLLAWRVQGSSATRSSADERVNAAPLACGDDLSGPLTVRVAMTLEQCWHAVPGGTASSVLETLRALEPPEDTGVEVVGVAARHSAPPPDPWTPPIPVRHLPLPRIALYEAWHGLRRPRVQAATGPVDVVHATTLAIPPRSAPLVVTVHDLAFLRAPEHFTRHGMRFFHRGLTLARRDADLVLCPSQSTWDECLDAGFPAQRLRLVPHGVSHVPVTDADVAAFRTRHRLARPYVLWCGTLEPRKNVATLLAAFRLMAQHNSDLDLVLVGPRGWGDQPAPDPNRVRLLGFLPTADLHAAYAGARAFCYPSLREGFGLPVLEAMAHGVPVVTSTGTAMAEFATDAGLLVDPLDAHALADALVRALGSEHDTLAAAAAERAADYTWARSAALTVAAYRELTS